MYVGGAKYSQCEYFVHFIDMSLILTLTLNNLINQNILMGEHRSCGQYDHKPPFITILLLMTLFQTKYRLALSLIIIDEKSSVVENYVVTKVLCYKFNIRETDM
jgi:hypothetical protein